MKDSEYQMVSTLTKLRDAEKILRSCCPLDDPHKTRLRGIIENLVLSIQSFERQVDKIIGEG